MITILPVISIPQYATMTKKINRIDNRINTCTWMDNNQAMTKKGKTIQAQENSKNAFKGENLCKDVKVKNELINKQLIKTLNMTPTSIMILVYLLI